MHKRFRSKQTVSTSSWQGEVERIGWGGKGIGRLDDGRLILLDSALAMFPGEVVTAELHHKVRHSEGIVTSIVRNDPQRVTPECPVAETCGACQLWGSGAKYGEIKLMMIDDLLHRQLPEAPDLKWYPAPRRTKRSRIQLHWDGQSLGFHARRSRTVVPVCCCPLAVEPLSSAIAPLRDALISKTLPDNPNRWELATDTPAKNTFATCSAIPASAWILQDKIWYQCSESLIHQLGGNEVAQFPGAFFQVCPQWAWNAFFRIFQAWNLQGETLYDLYGGGGFLSVMLADRFKEFTLVECSESSVKAASLNLTFPGSDKDRIELVNEMVELWMPASLGNADDVILLDPPRSGLPKELVTRLNSANAKEIVLVGCDGMSFCRDVKGLMEIWQINNLAVIDLFPNTVHAEFVAHLSKK